MGGLEFKTSLFATLFLGVFFICLQAFEYYRAGFTIRDSIYGSIFFIATGFHGIHVLVGTIFLVIVFLRSNIFNSYFFLGYELAI
jgi:heme/copper-type cytochrome/quinol oxidase subunit 3